MKRETVVPNTYQMTLEELAEELSLWNDHNSVRFDFGTAVPTECDSYRGIYEEIALGYRLRDRFAEYIQRETPKVLDIVNHLKDCVGRSFYGYKGGWFEMTAETPVWIANIGDATRTVPIGVSESLDPEIGVVILTSFVEDL